MNDDKKRIVEVATNFVKIILKENINSYSLTDLYEISLGNKDVLLNHLRAIDKIIVKAIEILGGKIMKLEEYKKEVNKNIKSLFEKANEDEKELLNNMINTINDLCEEKQELIDYLKEEIDKYEQSICKILKENDSGWGDIGFYEETRKLSDTYFKMKEILSKIEKSDK